MILWIALFILVVAISFVLAALSMKDYQEIPEHSGQEYGLFLIRKPYLFTPQLLTSLHDDFSKTGLVISFERLIKGTQSALVVYGPKNSLVKYHQALDLLELEDYAKVDAQQVSVREVGMRNIDKVDSQGVKNYFQQFPLLSEHEQFWWQLVLLPYRGKSDAKKSFQAQIRAVVFSGDQARRRHLTQTLQNLAPNKLIKLPKPFSNDQIIDFYQKRSLRKDEKNPYLKPEEVLQLLLI